MTPSTPSPETPEALSETVGSGEQAYTIKPLEWRKSVVSAWDETWDARGYSVHLQAGEWFWMPPDGYCDTRYPTREAAQADAEKHHHENTLAELIPAVPSPPAAAGEGKLYAERDPESLEPYYGRHLSAMTAEGLHDKCSIAAELAWRDRVLDQWNSEWNHWAKAGWDFNDRGEVIEAIAHLRETKNAALAERDALAARVVSLTAEREADTKRLAWIANYVVGIDASINGIEMLDQYDFDANPDGREWTPAEDADALRKTIDLAMAKEAAALASTSPADRKGDEQ